METSTKSLISIEKSKTSKIDKVDFDNLAFGKRLYRSYASVRL